MKRRGGAVEDWRLMAMDFAGLGRAWWRFKVVDITGPTFWSSDTPVRGAWAIG